MDGQDGAAPTVESKSTFAEYLARVLIAEHDYQAGYMHEAEPLAEACDIILSGREGKSFQMICLVDREKYPAKHFGMRAEQVAAIGLACRKYSGRAGFGRAPVVIRIIESGAAPASEQDRERCKDFRPRSLFAPVQMSAWLVDASTRAVWTNQARLAAMSLRGVINDALTPPRRSFVLDPAQPEATAAPLARPWATIGLLTLLVAMFGVEQALRPEAATGFLGVDAQTLTALGGMNGALVKSGQWFRLMTQSLLHLDGAHIAFNAIALLLTGFALEPFIGALWFLAIFMVGALGGGLASLALNGPDVVSVGASGAIMGLLACGYVAAFHARGARRRQLQSAMLGFLIPSLLPIANFTGQHIDFAAHLGGATAGAVAGLGLLAIWGRNTVLPRLRALAAVIALAGLGVWAWSIVPLSRDFAMFSLASQLIPPELMATNPAQMREASKNFVTRYPHDPRGHFYRALALMEDNDAPGAEHELRAALSESDVLRARFPAEFNNQILTLLAGLLIDTGRRDEAIAIARPVCAATPPSRFMPPLKQAGACP